MADSGFIGNWNLFMAISNGEVITVTNATMAVTVNNIKEGLIFLTSPGASFDMLVSEGSGYEVASGSTSNAFPYNMLLVVLSEDGNMIHGAFKQSETGLPETWWCVRQ